MRGLKPFEELRPGGVVLGDEAVPESRASWRTGLRPEVDLSRCVNCLLCWLYCPDAAVTTRGATFVGFDYESCKGCEICAAICPTQAITMEPEVDDGR
jgi:2-oxoacid:acceptor oxidoreductase delta subunit (pyruvate/2-ketoisovalerate family)